MQLTRYTDYSLRVLIYLALHEEYLVTTDEIAADFKISRSHLVKVVRNLAQAGFITSVRGRNGGMQLAHPAAEIVLGDVVRSTEENLDLVECFDRDHSRCRIDGACGLQRVLDDALRGFLAVLDRYTLADVTKRRTSLRQLLSSA